MSFQKINVCESTQVCVDTFTVFQYDQINMIRQDDGFVRATSDSADKDKYLEDILGNISYLLEHSTLRELRVHNIREFQAQWQTWERRVDFFLEVPWATRTKMIFTVYAQRCYLDGDEVSGYTRWRPRSVVYSFIKKNPGDCTKKEEYVFRCHRGTYNPVFSPAMERTWNATVYLVE